MKRPNENPATYSMMRSSHIGNPNAAVIAAALGNVARARNMSQLARDTGLSREGIYKALSGNGNPSFATILKIAQALGLRMEFKPASAEHH